MTGNPEVCSKCKQVIVYTDCLPAICDSCQVKGDRKMQKVKINMTSRCPRCQREVYGAVDLQICTSCQIRESREKEYNKNKSDNKINRYRFIVSIDAPNRLSIDQIKGYIEDAIFTYLKIDDYYYYEPTSKLNAKYATVEIYKE